VEKSGAPLVHVARDDKRMAAMRAALAFFAPGLPVLTFPAWDCLPYDRVSPNPEISAHAHGDARRAGAGAFRGRSSC
jgi:transcription-repair coupling factor (superfamily II helicase)